MKITLEEIQHIARLARLEIKEELLNETAAKIGKILDYICMLEEIDADGVPPTSQVIFSSNAFREDVEAGHLDLEKVMTTAPEMLDGSFVVPRIIE